MSDNVLGMLLLAVVATIVSIVVISKQQREVRKLRNTIDAFLEEKTASLKALQEERAASARQLQDATQRIKIATEATEEIQRLLIERSRHFPWLATAFSELQQLRFQRDETELRHKKRPAIMAANKVAEIARDIRETERSFRLTKYRIQFYENLFPWLVELSGEDIETLIKERLNARRIDESSEIDADEPVKRLLSQQEWTSL
jgi:hypothetical protein